MTRMYRVQTPTDSRLYRKGPGKEAKLSHTGHVLMDNRHGLASDGCLTQVTGTAERDSAKRLVQKLPNRRNDRVTVGADKLYDTKKFVADLRRLKVTPHVAQRTTNRTSAIDERTTRHKGYVVSQRKRKRVEEIFAWLKTVGLMRKTRHRGNDRVGWMFKFGLAVYNLLRINDLVGAPC